MSEYVEIEVKLSALWHNDPPLCEILLNDQEVFNGFVKEKKSEDEVKIVSWKGKLEDDTEHTLTIRLKAKNIGRKHTVIDPDGVITLDQLLYIEGVSLDQIELGHVAIKNSKYFPNGSDCDTVEREILNASTLGYNGDWKLSFRVPTYMWLLDNL